MRIRLTREQGVKIYLEHECIVPRDDHGLSWIHDFNKLLQVRDLLLQPVSIDLAVSSYSQYLKRRYERKPYPVAAFDSTIGNRFL